MNGPAVEEASVLSSIYCGEGEFELLQEAAQDGLLVQINSTVGGDKQQDVSLLFHMHPTYPSCPPDISVSSTHLSRAQCHSIRRVLLDRAAALPQEPMVHQLVEWLKCEELPEDSRGAEEEVKEPDQEERWTAVLLLDHIRSRNRYMGLLERWSQQLRLPGKVLLGRSILVVLQGARADIKEFCHLLKTVKVDVDSSGKKCKERMMKVLIETPAPSSTDQCLQGFIIRDYHSAAELTTAFQDMNLTELYQQILPSMSD